MAGLAQRPAAKTVERPAVTCVKAEWAPKARITQLREAARERVAPKARKPFALHAQEQFPLCPAAHDNQKIKIISQERPARAQGSPGKTVQLFTTCLDVRTANVVRPRFKKTNRIESYAP